MHDTWTAVDNYFDDLFMEDDAVLDATLQATLDADIPEINVAPNQGKMLNFFIKMMGAKKVLEIGTLGGYSTIWMARALPEDGKIITLELEQHHADVAQANLERAVVEDKVEIIVGMASETLPTLANEAPFDFIFIDADKPSNPIYFEWALKYSRVGTVIFIDNVVRDGAVINGDSEDEKVHGVRNVAEIIANEPRVEAFALQTVGSKSYDGFALLRVVS